MKEPLTQLHTEAMTAERTWTVEEIPVLTAAVSLPEPVPAADPISRRIRRYYQLQYRSFLRYCETYLLPLAAEEYRAALAASQPLPRLHAELTYQITYNEGGLWSLFTQSREQGPGGQAALLRRGGHLGSGLRLSGCPVLPLPPPERLEAAAAGGCGGTGPAAGGGRRLPVPRGGAPPAAAALQFPKLLSDGGGTGPVLPHVRHRPGHGGHPHVPGKKKKN